jgi:GNAT superfamily N-acetyltransferase
MGSAAMQVAVVGERVEEMSRVEAPKAGEMLAVHGRPVEHNVARAATARGLYWIAGNGHGATVTLGPFEGCAVDLAPGDRGVLEASWSSFTVEAVDSPDHPDFAEAYARLAREFAARGEMERREVIEDRLAWDPARPVGGHALLYEMLVIRRDGEIVAVRDHTAIVPPAVLAGREGARVVLHLSHVLVEPSMRGCGLASWLRALPIATARRCLALATEGSRSGPDRTVPGITLVAEMEHDDGLTPAVVARLRSYAKAGFRVVDPSRAPYAQPDFRSAAEIDRSGERPVPLCLVLRRVGREDEPSITGAELRDLADALHAMFGVHVSPRHMTGVRELAEAFPAAGDEVALLAPGAPASPATEARP